MSKELLVAAAVVVLCLGITAVALTKPAPAPSATDTASDPGTYAVNDPGTGGSTSFGETTPLDGPLGGGQDPLGGPAPDVVLPPLPDPEGPSPFVDPGEFAVGTVPIGGGVTGAPLDGGTSLAAGPREHVVKKGETLGEISRQYYGSTRHWKVILDANRMDDAAGLRENQKLVIPELSLPPAATTGGDAPAGADVYVVKKGDSLYRIAKRELGDASRYKEIQRLNDVSPDDLREGMKLRLPAKGAATAIATTGTDPVVSLPEGARMHSVAKDEYLTDIAKKYYGSTRHWREIVKANPGVDPERLKVGQKLVIPALGGATSGAAESAPVAADEYKVKAGDTFEGIAQRELGDRALAKRIAALNPGVDPGRLRIGQTLKLPAGVRGAGSSPAPLLPPPPTGSGLPGPGGMGTEPIPGGMDAVPPPGGSLFDSPTTAAPAGGSSFSDAFPGSTTAPPSAPAPAPTSFGSDWGSFDTPTR